MVTDFISVLGIDRTRNGEIHMTHIFIVNPNAGNKTFADDIRRKLSDIKGLNYFVFNTRYAGNEIEIIKDIQKIFENEKLRFYCCGGSGTMRNMLNGFDNLDEAEVAFFPCGLTNDFLKVFGKEQERFHNITELIYGDVVDIDYIKSNHGVMLNTFSVGYDSTCVHKYDEYRGLKIFGDNIPYTLSVIYSLFLSKSNQYEIEIDGRYYEGEISEIIFSNGMSFGGNMALFPGANITDGKGTFRMFFSKSGFNAIPYFKAMQEGNFKILDESSVYGNFEKIRIRRKDRMPFVMNQDGELSKEFDEWEAEVVHKGLHFVVPKGVRV